MADKTGIQWTDATWNPLSGCERISPGCANCYAKTLHDKRHNAVLRGTGKMLPMQYHTPFEVVKLHEDRLDQPLRWKRPRRIFVNSMSDLFHEDVPDAFIDKVFAVMALAPQHTFQILTKRAERMRDYILGAPQSTDRGWDVMAWASEELGRDAALVDVIASMWNKPLPNVWLGVSVENQRFADERIPLLLQTPAAVRFISAEPLLGPVDLTGLHVGGEYALFDNALNGTHRSESGPQIPTAAGRLDWVIVGGESGPGARPMHPEWARSLRDQCAAAGVNFFFKQWGEWAPGECGDFAVTRTEQTATLTNGVWHFDQLTPRQSEELHVDDEPTLYRLGKKSAGRLLDGQEWSQFPEVRT